MKTQFDLSDKTISPNLILAPMAGVTDLPFRNMVKSLGGVGLVVTEFISSEGWTRGNWKSEKMAEFTQAERPVGIQIFGGNPERMAAAAERVQELGADLVDINCGCPAKKVIKGGGGSDLLRDLPRLKAILAAVRKAVTIPITLKFRAGWDHQSINCVEVAKLAEDCGVSSVTLHARTRMQGYSGQADWNLIKAVKENVNIPVIGSGDVVTVADALMRLEQTGCDGVMIGRGAMANPWIFRQIAEAMSGLAPYEPTLEDKRELLFRYLELMKGRMPTEVAVMGKMKQLCSHFTKGLPNGAEFRQKVFYSTTVDEILFLFDEYFTGVASRGHAGFR